LWKNYYYNRFTALWIWSGTTQVSRYQKKHSPTHTYPDHQSSFICLLHSPQSTASSLFNPTVPNSPSAQPLSKSPMVHPWSSTFHPHSTHPLTQPPSSPRSTCPHHSNLPCCSTKTISPNHNLSPNSSSETLPFTSMTTFDHTYPCPLKCHLTIPHMAGRTSMQHTTSHTTAVQSLPINNIYLLEELMRKIG